MLPKNLSAKTLVQNVRTEILGENVSDKTTNKLTVLKCCPKFYPQKKVVQNLRTNNLAEKSAEKTTN